MFVIMGLTSYFFIKNQDDYHNCLTNIADKYCKSSSVYNRVYSSSNYEFVCVSNTLRELSEKKIFTIEEMEGCKK